MADATNDEERQRTEFARLLAEGMSAQEAFARATGQRVHEPGSIEAVARGAAQGATLGFADEIAGGIGSMAEGLADLTKPEFYEGKVKQRSMADAYREKRDAYRADDELAKEGHKGAFIGSELVGAAATAPFMGPTRSIGQAVLAGAKMGAASGLGGSKADLTEGDIGGAAADTAIGAGIGGLAGAGAYGLTKGISRGVQEVRQRFGGESSKVKAAAENVAREVASHADDPSLIGRNETVRTSTEKARELVKEWSGMLGEPFELRPSQVTGDRAAALAESRIAQFPKTMQRAQAAQAMQLERSARIIDMYVDGIAADPSRLGRQGVSEQLGEAVKRHIKSLYQARTVAAEPLYEAFEKAGGGVEAAPVLDAIRSELGRNKFNPSQVTGQLRTMLGELEKAGAGGGLSVVEANNFRKFLGEVVRGENSMLDNVDVDAQGAIARRIMESVDSVFDSAEASASSGPAIQLLRKANEAWRKGTEAINEATTDTIKAILAKTQPGMAGAAESIPKRLLALEHGQVAGVFRALNKASPEGAKQLRAQLLDEIMTGAGKPNWRSAPMAAEEGIARLRPQSALEALRKAEPVLQAAYAGDAKAQFALRRTYQLLQRLSFGPNLQGSQTASVAADAAKEALESATKVARGGSGGLVSAAVETAGRILGNGEVTAQAVSTPQGIKAFNEALAIMLGAKQGAQLSESAARNFLAALSRAGIMLSPVGHTPASPTGAYGVTAQRE